MFSFGHCPNQEGGKVPVQIFWPLIHQVIVPKISKFWLTSHNILVFCFGNFCHHYHHHHHKGNFNHHYHHWYFIGSYAQNVVFDVQKKRTKLPQLGGELLRTMPEKNIIFEVVSNLGGICIFLSSPPSSPFSVSALPPWTELPDKKIFHWDQSSILGKSKK